MIKRLESKEKRRKKEKRNQFILGAVLIFVMFASVFGIVFSYSLGSSSSTATPNSDIDYRGYKFNIGYGYYNTSLGNAKFYFSLEPNATDLLPVEVNLSKKISDYSGKEVYVSSSSYTPYRELAQNLNQFVMRIQEACAKGEPCPDKTLPTKDCTDNLIIIKNSTTNKIYEKDNCVYIEGNQRDILTLTDEFLLKIIGIK